MDRKKIVLVWLKRDLRTRDHAAFKAAIETGLPILPIYCFEPTLQNLPEWDWRHWRFAWEAVSELESRLKSKGLPLLIAHREVVPLLEDIHQNFEIRAIFSHQETGQKLTFDRDLAVKKWCRQRGIHWKEFRQDGVFRGLQNRQNWQERWEADMRDVQAQPDWPLAQGVKLNPEHVEQWSGPGLPPELKHPNPQFQPGGEEPAWRYLNGFLQGRALKYGRQLSKPGPSRKSCSRLSPYIAQGCLSARQIIQAIQPWLDEPDLGWNLQNFQSRMWWRSHYIQKLESEWQIEFEPMNRGFKSLDRDRNPDKLNAWTEGRTGIPMVDATMRCLAATGWTNFRLRATMATFATFALWLDWKAVAEVLGRLFTDFEPGIHFAQMQMQSGQSGYHPMRLFNPIYQSEHHDPNGDYIRHWVPELKEVPAPLIHRPWEMTLLHQSFYNCELGKDYPWPIVDYAETIRFNKERFWKIRQSPEVRKRLPKLWERHCLPGNIIAYRKSVMAEKV